MELKYLPNIIYDTLSFPKDSQLSTDVHTGIAGAVRNILVSVEEDPHREGLLQTPQRVEKMYAELTEGYSMNLAELINGAIFQVDYSEMVTVIDIDFSSLCEHRLLPFFGKCMLPIFEVEA